MDIRLQQERKDMDYKAMVEQVMMEGKILEDRAMSQSHVQCHSSRPQEHVFSCPPVSTLQRCYSVMTEILYE
jgi:hypothetical protein